MIKSITDVDYKSEYYTAVGEYMRQIVSPLQKYGVTYFGFSRVNQFREETFLTSRIDSATLWVDGKFYQSLFCDDFAKYNNTNILWNDIMKSSPEASELFRCFSETANIYNGLSMVRKCKLYVDHYYFASTRDNHSINHFYMNNLDLFESFICYFTDVAADLIDEAYKHRLFVPGCHDKTILTSDTCYSITSKMPMAKHFDYLCEFYQLTPREKQCAGYLSKGFLCKQIAASLNISLRTVEKFLINIKRKTCSSTLCQAIFKLSAITAH